MILRPVVVVGVVVGIFIVSWPSLDVSIVVNGAVVDVTVCESPF